VSHSSRGVRVSQTIAKVYFSKIQNEKNGKKIVKRFSHMTVLLLDRSRTKSFSICMYIYIYIYIIIKHCAKTTTKAQKIPAKCFDDSCSSPPSVAIFYLVLTILYTYIYIACTTFSRISTKPYIHYTHFIYTYIECINLAPRNRNIYAIVESSPAGRAYCKSQSR